MSGPKFPSFSTQTIVLAIINIVAVTVLLAGWTAGTLDMIFLGDATHVSFFIAMLVFVGIVAAFAGSWTVVKWIAEKLPAIGLAATVYGILVLAHGAGTDSGNIDAIRNAILTGVGAALGPNLTGIIGYVWLSTLSFAGQGEGY